MNKYLSEKILTALLIYPIGIHGSMGIEVAIDDYTFDSLTYYNFVTI